MIPDLVDIPAKEIYDVKSWAETPQGMAKVEAYRYAFSRADPNAGTALEWHAGLTYNYGGPNRTPNPILLPSKSNGKMVFAAFAPTVAGVIPYKLFEVEDERDLKRVPIPIWSPVRENIEVMRSRVYSAPTGGLIYANYYARMAARNSGMIVTGGLLAGVGIASLNSSMGGR